MYQDECLIYLSPFSERTEEDEMTDVPKPEVDRDACTGGSFMEQVCHPIHKIWRQGGYRAHRRTVSRIAVVRRGISSRTCGLKIGRHVDLAVISTNFIVDLIIGGTRQHADREIVDLGEPSNEEVIIAQSETSLNKEICLGSRRGFMICRGLGAGLRWEAEHRKSMCE